MTAAKILVIGSSWVGDMVMSHSLFQILKERQPAAIIDVVAPPATLPLLDFMPEVRRGIESPIRKGTFPVKAIRRLATGLRAEKYDRAIVIPRALKQVLQAYWARVPIRTGNNRNRTFGLLTDRRPIDTRALAHQGDVYVSLAHPPKTPLGDYPLPHFTVPGGLVETTLARLGLARPDRPLTILAPGSSHEATKRWPPDYYAEVARRRHAAGHEVWLLGAPSDREITGQVNEGAGGAARDLGGKTRLDEAVALVSLADEVLANDSGLMHVAAALDRNQVAPFGPTDPVFTAPKAPTTRYLSAGLDCSPCFKGVCPLGHFRCMLDLTPDRALAALDALREERGVS